MIRWERIDPTAEQMAAWNAAGACDFCGDRSSAPGCVCRYCDSCSSYWTAETREPFDEGEPARVDCPECVAAQAEEDNVPPSKAEIAEERGLQRFEEMHDEGLTQSWGRR